MNVRDRYRRYLRRRKSQLTSSNSKKKGVFESLEVRAAPGSILIESLGPLAAMSGTLAANEPLPALESQKGRRWQVRSFANRDAADSGLPLRSPDLNFTASLASRRAAPVRALASLTPKKTTGSPFSHDDALTEDNAGPSQSNAPGAHVPLPRPLTFNASSSSPAFGDPADSMDGLMRYSSARYSSVMTAAEGEGSESASGLTTSGDSDQMKATVRALGQHGSAVQGNAQPVNSQQSPVANAIIPPAATRQNPRNRMDVNADGRVSPVDVLYIINELNNPGGSTFVLATPSEASASSPTIYLDVNEDGRVSPIDALFVISYLNLASQEPIDVATEETWLGFHEGLADWHVDEMGGTPPNQGTVRAGSAILTEGNSFLVTIDREIAIPQSPLTLTFTYEDAFDTSDQGFMRDAFEAILVDQDGKSIVHTFAASREAFFNLTEGLEPAFGQGVSVESVPGNPTRVTLDLSHVFAETAATLQFRLINNDADIESSVRIIDVVLESGADQPPQVNAQLASDTAPPGAGALLTNDRLTNDPRILGTAMDDNALARLEVAVDGGNFTDITSLLTADQFLYDPGPLAAGPHSFLVRATDSAGQSRETTLDIQVNQPPTANAGGDRSVSQEDSVTLDGTLSSDLEAPLYAYFWTLPDGTTIDGSIVQHVFHDPGIQTVTLTVIDTAGSEAIDTVHVNVLASLSPLSVLDDGAWGYQERGVWSTDSTAGGWQDDYRFQTPGTGSRTASWITRVTPGIFDIYASWVPDEANATNAPYRVLDGNTLRGSTAISQQDLPDDGVYQGQLWGSLGRYQIDTGVVTVELNDNADGRVVADGVMFVPVGSPLQAEVSLRVARADTPPLRESDLQLIMDAAASRVSSLAADTVDLLAGVEFQIVDLPAEQLGFTSGRQIWIDVDAAGHGWFVDPTPNHDEEYSLTADGDLIAIEGYIGTRFDLLTVVAHELGHVLGHPDELADGQNAVMNGQLTLGTRRAEPSTQSLASPMIPVDGHPAATKFFVVDAAADRVFRYQGSGAENGLFDLPHGVTNPRGVASNVSGDTVWVIDGSSHIVSVQGPDGTVRGRWLGVGLDDPQGITTDGSDMWIVDAGLDRIYHYVGAANATSGAVLPTGSFALHAENTSPSDLVTDGSAMWVIDDAADAVFVYTATGEHLGHWSLDSENADPAGITKDPSGGSDLWVVDRVDRLVYRYTSATTIRIGAARFTDRFTLATDNTSPEGIADPPIISGLSPADGSRIPAGTPIIISGRVSPGTSSERIESVTVAGVPVQVLDAAGNFFSQVTVRPGQNLLNVAAANALNEVSTESLAVEGIQPLAGTIDFSQLSDVTASLRGEYGLTSWDDTEHVLYAELSIRSVGSYPVDGPLLVGVTNLSDPSIRVRGTDGTTPDGVPYFTYRTLQGAQSLVPGQSTETRILEFYDPDQAQFTYDLVILGSLNQAPTIISVPDIEALAGKPYVYDAQASDPDGDSLAYSLTTSPPDMTIDATTGRTTWSPTTTDIGNHSVTVRVEDGRGGTAEQRFVLSTIQPPPNRSPVITSVPVVQASVGDGYHYDVTVTDADDDLLTFALTTGPAGLSINPQTGEVTWIPAGDQLGISEVHVEVSDGRGGTAAQSFSVVVGNAVGNAPPIFTSEPAVEYGIPGTSHLPTGSVTPNTLSLDLEPGQTSTRSVSVTLPDTPTEPTFTDVVFVIDETVSMETRPNPNVLESGPSKQAWVSDAAKQLDAALQAQGIGPNRFGLVGFGEWTGAPASPIPVRDLGTVDFFSLAHGGHAAAGASVTPADLDKDGDVDFITANTWVFVFLNQGNGQFDLAIPYVAGVDASTAAVADVNGDGTLDVVAAAWESDKISVLLGAGDGTFSTPIISRAQSIQPPLSRIADIETGDLNGDGKVDLALVDAAYGYVSILLGNGDGSLSQGDAYQLADSPSPRTVSMGDLDNDGDLDIVTGNHSPGSVTVLLGRGDGTFGGQASYQFVHLMSAAIADVNEDGVLDVVATGNRGVQILPGNGDGTFGLAITAGAGAMSIAGSGNQHTLIHDLNGDGHLDLVSLSEQDTVSVLIGDGTGQFGQRFDFMVGTESNVLWSIGLADVDGDGALDVICGFGLARVSVLRGHGDGTFDGPVVRHGPVDGLYQVEIADVNGDGHRDIVAIGDPDNDDTVLSISLGDGAGRFLGRSEMVIGVDARLLAVGDVDGDGDVDVVTSENGTDYRHSAVQILLNSGTGAFVVDKVYVLENAFGVSALRLADVDRDGTLDIVTSSGSGEQVLLGLGDGQFRLLPRQQVGRATTMVVGDLNGDAIPDLVSSHDQGIVVSLGDGTGAFDNRTTYAGSAGSIAIGDIDGDGDVDIAFPKLAGVSLLWNDGVGSFTTRTSIDLEVSGLRSIVLSDLNGDRHLDIILTKGGYPNAPYFGGDGIIVLFGNGLGEFSDRGIYEIVRDPRAIVVGDLNEDGAPDLIATSDYFLDAISVALNDGYGDFGRFGTADMFAHASGGVVSGGGLADGYAGIDRALTYAIRPDANTYFVLVTTNDRSVIDASLGFASTLDALAEQGVLLDVVVDAQYRDGKDANALGVDSNGNAIVADGAGSYTLEPGGQFVSGKGKLDYIDLAWLTGGSAWDLNQLSQSGSVAMQAFVDRSVREILGAEPISVIASDLNISVQNLTGSLKGIGPGDTATFDVQFTGDGRPRAFDLLFVQGTDNTVVGSIPVKLNVAPYTYQLHAVDPDGDHVTYSLLEGPPGAMLDAETGELRWDPAAADTYHFRVQVADGKGGVAIQEFALNVRDLDNTAPTFDSEPLTTFDIPGSSHASNGIVTPTTVDVDLREQGQATQTVSLTLPDVDPQTGAVDVVFIVDESYSMESDPQAPSPSKQAWIGDAARELDATLEARGFENSRFGLVGLREPVVNDGSPVNELPVRELGALDIYSLRTGPLVLSADSIATGDLDLDGHVDFVTGTGANLLVFLNDGNGQFSRGVAMQPTGPGWVGLALADFNSDGVLDLAANVERAGLGPNVVDLFIGRGDGTFEPRVAFETGSFNNQYRHTIDRFAVADLNRDGVLDLAVSGGAQEISVLLGRGDGTFSAPRKYEVGYGPETVDAGDLDSDGDLDLVVANASNNSLTVLLGNGDGIFGDAMHIDLSTEVFSAQFADVNEDGRLDVVADGRDLMILLGLGDGRFHPADRYGSNYGAGSGPGGLTVVADVNADGHLDLVSPGDTDGVAIRLGDGSGEFVQRHDYTVLHPGVGSVAVADVDADGHLDVIAGDFLARVSVLRGLGNGAFSGPVVRYGVPDGVKSAETADLDGDGHVDMVTLSDPDSGPSTLSISFGDGMGSFSRRVDYPSSSSLTHVALGDLDGDGDVDIVTNGDGKSVQVFHNPGDGAIVLDHVYQGLDQFFRVTGLHLVDSNQDGMLDIVAVSAHATAPYVSILRGLGGGLFGTFDDSVVGTASATAVGDLNGDAISDLLLLGTNASMSVFLGADDGRFHYQAAYSVTAATSSLTTGDIDHDGDLDVLIAGGDNRVTLLRNNGQGLLTHDMEMAFNNPYASSSVHSVHLTDVNGDSNLDIVLSFGRSMFPPFFEVCGVIIASGDGNGIFTAQGEYLMARNVGAHSTAVGDLNADGHPDLILVSNYLDAVAITLNDGYGDFGRFGSADMLAHASGLLHSTHDAADGYAGVDVALDYAFRPGATTYFVLVTTNNRSVVDGSLGFASIRDALTAKGVLLDVVVDARFQDGRQSPAMGVDAAGNAIVTDGAGGYTVQPGGEFVSGKGKVDYIDLAWLVGGSAWDLNELSQSGSVAMQAFVDRSVREILGAAPISVIASDSTVIFQNLTGELTGIGPGDTASFDVQITGDGAAHAFDLLFVREGAGQILGSIPVTINTQYVYQAHAIDGEHDLLTYSLNGPAGSHIDPHSGEIRWRPKAVGSYPFRVEARDGRGGVGVQEFTVTVTEGPPNHDPEITPVNDLSPTANVELSIPISATDPDGHQLSYYLTNAPAGMEINRSTGVIHWTPGTSQLGHHNVSIKVLDGRGGSAALAFALHVLPEPHNASPRIVSVPVPTVGVGQTYLYRAEANDANQDTLTWDLAVGPVGMVVEAATGVVVWNPTAFQRPVDVVLRVRDGQGGVDLQRFQLQLLPPNSSPVITSTADSRAIIGLPHQYQVQAQDGENDRLTYSLAAAPPGMLVGAASGLIEWTPTGDQLGEHTLVVRVSDGNTLTERTLSFEVVASAPNTNPTIDPVSHLQPRADRDFQFHFEASDVDGDPLTFHLDSGPTGLTLAANGQLNWHPTAEQLGDHNLALHVTDGRGGMASLQVALTVVQINHNRSPVITSSPIMTAVVGQTYAYDLHGSDEDGDPLRWELPIAPTGMSVNGSTGTIRWTPTADQIGERIVTVWAFDGQPPGMTFSLTSVQTFRINVRAVNTPPQITSTPLTVASTTERYNYAVRATDVDSDALTFSLDTAPAGMSIDPITGVIQWDAAPTPTGSHDIAVRVADGNGGSAVQSYALVVSGTPSNEYPTIVSTPQFRSTAGVIYQYDVDAHDPEGAQLHYLLIDGPAGMQIDPSTGLVQWLPTSGQVGSFTVTVAAEDPGGAGATQSFSLNVLAENHSPHIDSSAPGRITAGTPYRYDVIAVDDDGDRIRYALQTAPAGLTIDPSLGRISWATSLNDVGFHAVEVRVSDGRGGEVVQSFQLEVTTDAIAPALSLFLSNNPVQIGDAVTVVVSASDNVDVHDLTLSVGGSIVVLDAAGRATVPSTTAGTFEVFATARDAGGLTSETSVDLVVLDPSDLNAPSVVLDSPHEDSVITSPTAVIGTVADDNLRYYTLSVASLGSSTFTEFARGTAPVTNSVLGTFDPSVLINDNYVLRLWAVDAGGRESIDERVISVAGDLKLGNFAVSFTDLSIPLSGIPLAVARTYDTLNAGRQADFGFGWRFELSGTDLSTSVEPSGAEAYGIYNPFYDGARVYVTLPGGQREGFTFRPQLVSGLAGFLLNINKPHFVPDAGVTSTLSVDPADLYINAAGEAYGYSSSLAFNPTDSTFGGRYILTTQDGLAYEIDGASGDLRRLEDTNGNSLTFSRDGVTSSAGQQITVERDPQDRISAVVDPLGNRVRYQYDVQGNLVAVTDRENNVTQFEYNEPSHAHYLTEIIDPLGRSGIRTEYDDQGRLAGLRDADNHVVQLVHDLANSTETIIDQLGNPTVYGYDARGNVVRVVDAEGGVRESTYDGEDNLLSETAWVVTPSGPQALTTTFTYDRIGNQLSATDPLGNTTLTTFQVFSGAPITIGSLWASLNGQDISPITRPSSTVDPLGNTTTNAYDANGNLLSITDPSGQVTSLAYDGAGNPTSMSFGGGTTAYEYDTLGHVIRQTDALGHATTYTYDANGNQLTATTTLTTPAGTRTLVTTTEYDALGRVIQETDAEGAVIRTEYDAVGNRTALTDALGRRTQFVFDERGQLVETIFPDATLMDLSDNPRTRTEYDAAGRETATIDELGRRTEMVYDKIGRLIETIYPDATPADLADNPRIRTEYDEVGQTTAQIDERGNRTEFGYDLAGRQVLVRDALGHETTTAYDAAGRSIASADALGHTTRFTLDASGRQVETLFLDGTRTTNGFDMYGRLASRTDQLGRSTHYEYDAVGKLVAVVDALSQRTEYGYDEAGSLITQRDANGHVTRYEYDGLSRRIATVLPLGQRSTNEYNAVGNLVRAIDFNGDLIEYSYDAGNRLLSTTYPNGTAVSFTYTPTGQRETYTDARGVTHWSYDARDRLLSRIDPDGATISYTYDAVGNRTSLATPAGTVSYTFDALNRLETVTDPDSGVTRYQYNPVSYLVRTDLPNGTSETRDYDSLNRLVFLENLGPGGVISSYRYTLATTGRRDTVVEDDGRRVDYRYDALDRLTGEQIADAVFGDRTIDYTYDPVGNRLTRNDTTDGLTTYTYDDNDQLLTETLAGEVTQYTYDDNGNTLSKISVTDRVFYDWDFENRLIAADTDGDGTMDVTNRYDADGIRVAQRVSGEETRFLIDTVQPYQQVALEYMPSGVVKVSYVHGLDLISQNRPAETGKSFYHVDSLGSTQAMSNASGLVTDRYIYDAFGRAIGQVGTTGNAHLFAGEQRDAATGLDYLRARHLDTTHGRFISRDIFPGVFRSPDSLNRFVYAVGNPINRIDPSGLLSLIELNVTQGIESTIRSVSVAKGYVKTIRETGDFITMLAFAFDVVTYAASTLLEPDLLAIKNGELTLVTLSREFSPYGNLKSISYTHSFNARDLENTYTVSLEGRESTNDDGGRSFFGGGSVIFKVSPRGVRIGVGAEISKTIYDKSFLNYSPLKIIGSIGGDSIDGGWCKLLAEIGNGALKIGIKYEFSRKDWSVVLK